MKKKWINYYVWIMGALFSLAVFCNCSDDAYGDKYSDPSKISEATCDKLMTGVFVNSKAWTNPSHDGFNWGQRIGVFAQVFGTPNSNPYSFDSYGTRPDGRWNDFYNSLIVFRTLEHLYSQMSDADKAENDLFLWVAQLFIYQQLTEVVAIWGNVPFTEAGTLVITGDIKTSTPKYDTESELYTLMLSDLKTLSDKLANTTFSDAATGKLAAQDYINGGDILKWRKFANALRLRLGMRLSSQGALTNAGQSAVFEILANEAAYPLPSDNSDMIAYFSQSPDNIFQDLGKGDRSRILGWAADAHLSRMVNDHDPRLYVLYDPVGGTGSTYAGFDFSKPYDSEKDRETGTVETYYSSIDSGTYRKQNTQIPAIIFSAAEIWFLKAEAYQRGLATGNAEEAFKKAIDLSVRFYYNINAGATLQEDVVALPDDQTISSFAAERWNAYASKEEAIATQKWLHFGFLQEFEAWTELRRTGLPRLFYSVTQGAGSGVSARVPNRLRYPDDERTYNPNNCLKIEDDKFDTQLLWMNPDWHDEGVVN